jgi:hypothetical protein
MPKDFAKPGIDGKAPIRHPSRKKRWIELGLLMVVGFELFWLFAHDLPVVQKKVLPLSAALVTTDPHYFLSKQLEKGYYIWAKSKKPCLPWSFNKKWQAFKVSQVNHQSHCLALIGPMNTIDIAFKALHDLSATCHLEDVQIKIVA